MLINSYPRGSPSGAGAGRGSPPKVAATRPGQACQQPLQRPHFRQGAERQNKHSNAHQQQPGNNHPNDHAAGAQLVGQLANERNVIHPKRHRNGHQ